MPENSSPCIYCAYRRPAHLAEVLFMNRIVFSLYLLVWYWYVIAYILALPTLPYMMPCLYLCCIYLVLNFAGRWCGPVQSAGLDEGDGPAGTRKRAGAVTDRPAQLQQPGQNMY